MANDQKGFQQSRGGDRVWSQWDSKTINTIDGAAQ